MTREVPGIQPTVGGLGQYSVGQRRAAAVPVPRSKALDLADTLNAFMGVAKSYGGLQKQQEQIGIEQAQLVEEQNVIAELKKQKDVDGFSPLATTNRDRAYRDALLKRHINNTMLPSLQAKEADLMNVEKYGDRNTFNQGVDEAIRGEWDSLVSAVGEDIANTTAAKALWSVVTTPYKNSLALKHEQAVDQLIASEKINEITISFNNAFNEGVMGGQRLQALVESFDDQIASDLPQYTKPQRTDLLLQAIDQQARRLRADRRYTDAARLLDGIELVKINGQNIFQSTAAFSKLTEIRRSINESLFNIASKDTETMDAEFKGAGRLAFLTMSGKNSVADLDEADYQNLRDALRYLAPDPQSTPDAELDRIINEELFGQEGANPSRALLFAMNNLARKNPDDGLRMLQRTTPSILTTLKNTEGILPASARVDLREVREGLETEFRTAFAQHDPLKGDFTDTDFLKDKPEFKGYAGLRKLSEELNAGGVIRNYTSYTGLDKTLENALIPAAETIEKDKKTYKDILGNAFLSSYKDQSRQIIQTKALDYARDLFLENPDDPELKTKVDTFIQTEVQKDVDLFKELAEATANKLGAFRQPSMTDFRAIVKKEKEEAESWFPDPIEYKSLVTEELDLGLVYADQDKAFAVKEDPSRRHKDVLKGLLVQHGIPSYDKKYAKYLSKAGVDFRSVRLVRSTGELDSILRRWAPVIAKIHGEMELLKQGAPTDLNANEEDTWKEMRDFKVFDIQTLNDFKTSQQQLLNEPRR